MQGMMSIEEFANQTTSLDEYGVQFMNLSVPETLVSHTSCLRTTDSRRDGLGWVLVSCYVSWDHVREYTNDSVP